MEDNNIFALLIHKEPAEAGLRSLGVGDGPSSCSAWKAYPPRWPESGVAGSTPSYGIFRCTTLGLPFGCLDLKRIVPGVSERGIPRRQIAELCAKVNCYHMEQFGLLRQKMKAASDGDGSLLDHSVVVYGSGLSDPNRHDHHNLPTLIAGKARGQVRTGRHLKLDKETPMANLWLSVAGMSGVPCEKLGDSTGNLAELSGF